MDRPRADDHLATTEFGFFAIDQGSDADAARALEYQLRDLGQRRDRQIVAQSGARIEIADRCRDARS